MIVEVYLDKNGDVKEVLVNGKKVEKFVFGFGKVWRSDKIIFYDAARTKMFEIYGELEYPRDEEPHCAKNCKHFLVCSRIPKRIWKLPIKERDKLWRKIAKKCKYYEKG